MIVKLNHVAISVSDLDRSIAFYTELFGMEVVIRGDFGGEAYETVMNLKGASGRAALLRFAEMQIELFEFASPKARASEPDRPVCDHGITHFCVEVEDLDAAFAWLQKAGMRFHCPPVSFVGGAKATYGRDPDGNVIELLEPKSATSGAG